MKSSARLTVLLATASAISSAAFAQAEYNVPVKPVAVDEGYLSGLEWRNLGPKRGGRSIAVAGSAARPNEYYFGATGGGLWKTTDGGTSWRPMTDAKTDNGVVGGVAICEANPDVVYFATGEGEIRGNIMPGNGVFKTVDAGKTWTSVGLKDVRNLSRIRIDPKNCENVLVAGLGHYGAPNAERGVYRTTDGGKSWAKTLFRDDKTGAVDISIDPKDPRIVYASLWEMWRKPWGMSSGGPGSGLFKSVDGGANWTELSRNPGLPAGPLGKIGISVSPVDGKRVYALIEAKDGGMFVSDDAGATWTRSSDSRDIRQRAFYYSRVTADPKVKDRVYVMNVRLLRSDDAGKTFPTKIKVPHGDNHDLWIAPNDNNRMIEANDGGGTVSVNGGATWTNETYPTAQIYRITTTGHFPYFVCGAQQDNSTICVPSKGWDQMNSLGGQYGFAVGGGESGYIANDPNDPNIFYAGSYSGYLERFDYRTGASRMINVWPDRPMGMSSAEVTERFQWTFPIVFDPQDKSRLYVASQHVFQSVNGGQSWTKISPDLTRHDPATMGVSGGPITHDQTGVETFATVFALAPSRLEKDVIWAGSDDGLVHITRDDGKSWQDVTPANFPQFLKITTIEDSPSRPGTAFLTGNRFLLDDLKPYVYKTVDYGAHWTPISAGIPADEVAHSIREDIHRPGLLYLGTERGVWVSFDDGLSWQKLQRNLPTVQVSDLAVTEHDLVIATHGRSMWSLDNIDVIRQLDGARGPQRTRLFRPVEAYRQVDEGVTIDYFLPTKPKSLSLDILDSNGALVRHFVGKPGEEKKKDDEPKIGEEKKEIPQPSMKAGLNRFTWDMRYPGFTEFKDMILWSTDNKGVLALPGQYQVRLNVDGKSLTQPAEIRIDPRIKVTPADLRAQFDLANKVQASVTRANEGVLLIRGIRAQIADRIAKATDSALKQQLGDFNSRLATIEGEIYQVANRSEQDPLNYPIRLNDVIGGLLPVIQGADARPTDQTYQVFDRYNGLLETQLRSLDALLSTTLPSINSALRSNRLAPIERKAEPAVEPGTMAIRIGATEGEEEH